MKTSLEPTLETPAHKQPSDVFAFLSRYLPKRTDVLWVAQELEHIRRLPDLSQQAKAQGELYMKIERHIIASQLLNITTDMLRAKIKSHFQHEVEGGFLGPVFSGRTKLPAKQSARRIRKDHAPSQPTHWKFSQLKDKFASEPIAALLKTGSGKVIPVSVKGTSWESGTDGKRRFVVAMKDLRVTQQPLQNQLQAKETELAETKRSAVKRELEWQSRILKLEQEKQASVEQELELQQRIAKLEANKQVSVKRELALQQHVAELERAKQVALKQQQHVTHMRREIEEFSKKLSQNIG